VIVLQALIIMGIVLVDFVAQFEREAKKRTLLLIGIFQALLSGRGGRRS
jgi:hypothetical protein